MLHICRSHDYRTSDDGSPVEQEGEIVPEYKITVVLTVPEGTDANFEIEEVVRSSPAATTQQASDDLPEVAVRMIQDNAPATEARFQRQFVDRCAETFGLIVRTAKPPSTRTYLSLVPPKRYGGVARVGAVETRSSRAYAACDLAHADEFPGAEAAEGKWVTIYLRSDSDVDTAVALVRFAMQERGWSGE
jgi:hypothetical protein